MVDKDKLNITDVLLWSIKKIKVFKFDFFINLSLGFTLMALNLITVYFTQMTIQKVTQEKEEFIQTIIFLVSFTLIQMLFQSIYSYISGRLSAKVAYNMKEHFNKKISNYSEPLNQK